jgi:MFS family permease
MAHVGNPAEGGANPWTTRLVGLVMAGFVVGAMTVVAVFPDPEDGPTPGKTRFAFYGIFAAVAVGLALVPLVVGLLERRSSPRVVLRWRVVLVTGVVLAVATLGAGAWSWAYPPHNLRECFTAYHGDATGTPFRLCEDGRLNRALGDRRLNEGMAGGAAVLLLTAAAAARMRSRSEARAEHLA